MSVPDQNVVSLPNSGGDLQIRVGGMTIKPIPDMSKITFSETDAVSKLVAGIQPILAQLKAIGDLVSVVTALIDTVNAIPDAITEGDPTIMSDALEDLAKISDKLLPYIPAVQHVQTVLDILGVIKVALSVISTMLSNLEEQVTTVSNLRSQASATGNTSLDEMADQIEEQNELALEHSQNSINALLLPLTIITEILDNISVALPLPEIPNVFELGLSDLQSAIETIYNALDVIV